MAEKIKIVHYINQFFAGIGGEEKGDSPLESIDGPKGPGIGFTQLFKDRAEIIRTIWCGDNRIIQNQQEIVLEIEKLVAEVNPDIVLAGPAFNAGRYGLACGLVAKMCTEKLNIPALTGLYPENPAVDIYKRFAYIWPTAETAAGMRKAVPAMTELAVKLGRDGVLESALIDGYIPRGFRNNEYVPLNAAKRAVQMLFSRLKGENPQTEVPLRSFEQVKPAEPLKTLSTASIAIVTGGGMVPKGNPDKLKQAFSDSYGLYSIQGMDELPAGDFKGIHGGFDSTWVDEDPDRVVPVDVLRVLEREGKIGKLHNEYYSLCGIGTNVAASKKLGAEIAEDLRSKEISAAIFTST